MEGGRKGGKKYRNVKYQKQIGMETLCPQVWDAWMEAGVVVLFNCSWVFLSIASKVCSFLALKGGGALVQKIITELLLRAGLWAVEIIVVNEVSIVFSLMELIVP